MNFFKKSKYSLSSGKPTKKEEKKEHFHKLNTGAEQSNGNKKGKAPPKIESCFTIVNSTPFVWNLEPTDSREFPKVIPASERKVVQFNGGNTHGTAKYKFNVEKDGNITPCTISVDVKKNETSKKWFLKIDWADLASIDGISVKPDETGSEEGLHFENDETRLLVSVTYSQDQEF
uniref:Uncharacterized LOC104266524 n=1 Tax=Ciona intestinalis TaxID=7719 RepID=F6RSX5_CIOIN|nr:uncharacterized protein LOC104266524 [Ciona intestinalis]|eukprot:XP_009861228.1 uncharacterized protein LOC104266524 [Ciona intestinalis]